MTESAGSWVPQMRVRSFDLLRGLVRSTDPSVGLRPGDVTRLAAEELIRFAYSPRGAHTRSWQEAWNLLAAERHGVLVVGPIPCPDCHGKRFSFSTRNISRSVSRGIAHPGLCLECDGRGQVPNIQLRVSLVEIPVGEEVSDG